MTRRTSKRKTSHRTKPVRRGAARRTSRRVRANTIPPPPQGNVSDLAKWALKTYQKGTRVRTRVAMDVWFPSEDRVESIPAGTVGKVADVDPSSGLFIVLGHVNIPLLTSSTTTRWMKNATPEFIDTYFEPLDDNWGPLVVAPKRHSPPPTSGWQKQLSASRRMRARKVQPNENEHRIGPPPCVYLDAGRFRSIDAAIDKVQSIRSDGYRAFIVVQPSRSQPGAVTYAVVRPTKQCEDHPFIRDSLW